MNALHRKWEAYQQAVRAGKKATKEYAALLLVLRAEQEEENDGR